MSEIGAAPPLGSHITNYVVSDDGYYVWRCLTCGVERRGAASGSASEDWRYSASEDWRCTNDGSDASKERPMSEPVEAALLASERGGWTPLHSRSGHRHYHLAPDRLSNCFRTIWDGNPDALIPDAGPQDDDCPGCRAALDAQRAASGTEADRG